MKNYTCLVPRSPLWSLATLLGLVFLPLFVVQPVSAQFSDRVIEKAKGFSVLILMVDFGGDIKGSGSGFFISDQGHVATNFHVAAGAHGLVVVFSSEDRVFIHPGEVVAVSEDRDLAILKTKTFRGAGVATLAVAPPSSGQRVMTIGFPGALQMPSTSAGLREVAPAEFRGSPGAVAPYVPATFSGEVGRFQQEAEMDFPDGSVVRADMIQHGAKTSGGNSGGALIDVEGRAAGVVFAGNSVGAVDYAHAIHSAHLVELARTHRIPIKVSMARAKLPGSKGVLPIVLILAVAALAIVSFLMALKKPREAIVDGLSRLTIRGTREAALPPVQVPVRQAAPRQTGGAPSPSSGAGRMVLRGRGPDGRSFHLEFDAEGFRRSGGRLVLGRNRELCQLHIPHDSVSRQHVLLSLREGTIFVEDRNSGNGTLVNGRELPLGGSPVPLRSGDCLRVGEVDLMFDLLP